jgi:hypothetical protein
VRQCPVRSGAFLDEAIRGASGLSRYNYGRYYPSALYPVFRHVNRTLVAWAMRHSLTVSSRTPNASARRGLDQPDKDNRMQRARSASARSRECANSANAMRCRSSATTV